MSNDILNLQNQLCFALYACSKEITKMYRPLLDKIGLTYTQYITLLALWEEEDSITVKKLGNKLLLDSGTLTPLLKKLEKNGLIERTRDKDDERNVIIVLTQQGRELKEKALEIPEKLVNQIDIDVNSLIKLRNDANKLLSSLNNNHVKK
ncbi:MAG: transcriptional regulator, MarR family [Bacillales bacterium]|jgi:DNA-binding MarR family transcriptional regulator|nr:transcriptional regulator, MarR family [Bacillales bacterium]